MTQHANVNGNSLYVYLGESKLRPRLVASVAQDVR
jgi:hypothetical protein